MFFGIIADFIASFTTVLFPVFASYKALRSADQAQLAPWLIYWIIFNLLLLVESWTVFVIGWLPFYSWIRLFCLSYLVLPQTQGAKLIYYDYVQPYIANHERQIELFIGDLHAKASQYGLQYLEQVIELVKQRVLGMAPTPKQAAPPPASYAASLLSRFAIPAARPAGSFVSGATAPASDFYGMLSSTLGAVTSGASASKPRDLQAAELHASGNLLPSHLAGASASQKQEYLTSQKDKLSVLMRALDKEQHNLDLAYGDGRGSGTGRISRDRSDQSFDTIQPEEAENGSGHHGGQNQEKPAQKRTASGGWASGWFGGGQSGGTGYEDVARRVVSGLTDERK